MVRFYKRPILLIEFDPNKSFSLQVSIHRNPVVKIKLASKCPSSNFQVSITVEHEIMGVRGYGISLGVFSSIAHEWDVELNTRTEISHLQTTMYYFVYHINTIALYCQQKSTLLMNENKRIDNPLIKKTLKSFDVLEMETNNGPNFQYTKLSVIYVVLSDRRNISGTRPKSAGGKSFSCRFSFPAARNAITKAVSLFVFWFSSPSRKVCTSLSVSDTDFSASQLP